MWDFMAARSGRPTWTDSRKGARAWRGSTRNRNSTSTRAHCSPALPDALWLANPVILPWSQYGLPTGERLLPEALKEARLPHCHARQVATWSLQKDYWPTQRGFDSFYGSFNGDLDCLRKTIRRTSPTGIEMSG